MSLAGGAVIVTGWSKFVSVIAALAVVGPEVESLAEQPPTARASPATTVSSCLQIRDT